MAGSVDAFSFVVSGVLLAPDGEGYRLIALLEDFDNHMHLHTTRIFRYSFVSFS